MDQAEAKTRFTAARVARLATVGPDGAPHLVPMVFAVHDGVVYTAVDAKPKTTPRLRRLTNIAAHPLVSVLVDHYDEDWTRLWWVRADGLAEIHRGGAVLHTGYDLLRAKYPQYRSVDFAGVVITMAVDRWVSWQA